MIGCDRCGATYLSDCTRCRLAYAKAYYRKNREKLLARKRGCTEEEREQSKEKSRAWRRQGAFAGFCAGSAM